MKSPSKRTNPATRSLLSSAGWLLAGTLVVLGVFEIGFRLTEVVIRLSRPKPVSADKSTAKYTILCEGDSFTYGIGGKDYPLQLERILNRRHGAGTFRTVNKGIPGLNTALLADHLEEHFEKYRPDILLIIAGENNSWNAIRLTSVEGELPFRLKLDRVLLNFRVYKFFKIMIIGLRHGTFHAAQRGKLRKIERAATHLIDADYAPSVFDDAPQLPGKRQDLLDKAHDLANRGEYEKAIGYFRGYTDLNPGREHGYIGLGACLSRLGRLDASIEILGEGARKAPHEDIFFQLGYALYNQDKFEEGVERWKDGLRAFPTSKKMFQALAKAFHEQGRLWAALGAVEDIPKIETNPLYQYLEHLGDKEGVRRMDIEKLISGSFRADIERIIKLSKRHGVTVVFASYPDDARPEVFESARAGNVRYLDFRTVFRSRFKSRSEYISADNCHCNTAGYRAMAEVFADEVEKILKLDR